MEERYTINDMLKDIYYDAKTGYKSQKRLYLQAKKINKYITYKDINNFLQEQEEYQMNRKQKVEKKLQYNITAPRGYYQADLMFYKSLENAKGNKKNSVILCLVEIATRKGYAVGMKDKEADTVLDGLIKISAEIKEPIKAITTDNGSEFTNELFNGYLNENHIKHYYVQPKDKNSMSIVERFNRTIKQFNNRYFKATKKYNWFEILDDVVYNYNHTFNNSIGGEPEKLTNIQIDLIRSNDIQKNIDVRQRIMKKINSAKNKDGKIYARTRLEQRPFNKEGQIWSDRIHEILKPVLNKFELSDTDKRFGINDLQILRSNKVQTAPEDGPVDDIMAILGKARANRNVKKEGLQEKNILPTREKRVRELTSKALENLVR